MESGEENSWEERSASSNGSDGYSTNYLSVEGDEFLSVSENGHEDVDNVEVVPESPSLNGTPGETRNESTGFSRIPYTPESSPAIIQQPSGSKDMFSELQTPNSTVASRRKKVVPILETPDSDSPEVLWSNNSSERNQIRNPVFSDDDEGEVVENDEEEIVENDEEVVENDEEEIVENDEEVVENDEEVVEDGIHNSVFDEDEEAVDDNEVQVLDDNEEEPAANGNADDSTDSLEHLGAYAVVPKQKYSPDIDAITNRLKKQQLEAKPNRTKFLDDPPNPFSRRDEQSKLKQKAKDVFDYSRIDECKGDVFKSAKLLVQITEEMPVPDDDHSCFVPPKNLRVELFPHQHYGCRWMNWREQRYPGGGVLADEMGLGKTIMAICTILKGKEERAEVSEKWFTPANKRLIPSKATLVICPVGCMTQWASECESKARGLTLETYHGPNRTSSAALLSRKDVVITSYNIVCADIPKPDDDEGDNCKSPLMKISWERIILDEGHVIRNATTHTALACCRMTARYRWIVTGTPVHNRPADFYSLVKFLKLEPFDNKDVWTHWIGLKDIPPENKKRFHTIGKSILLRRTKDEVKLTSVITNIPPKHVEDIEIELSSDEKNVYDYVFDYAKQIMTKFLQQQKDRNDQLQYAANKFVAGARRKKENKTVEDRRFSEVLVLLTRLRQLAVLPYLIRGMLEDENLDSDDEEVSYDVLSDPANLQNPVFNAGYKSSKIRATLAELEKIKADAVAREEPMDKVIIVSQWTSFLDILGQHLRKKGYRYDCLDGRLKVQDRAELMRKFNNNKKSPQILLLSIAAGGVGLNLVGANHVFFMEPHWNPQQEKQAQDRVHRFGQTKPVFIKRFICDGTVEPHILGIQAKKIELADGLLNNTKKFHSAGINIADLKSIFGLS